MATTITSYAEIGANRRRTIVVYCVETAAGAATEWSTTGIDIPRAGDLYVQSVLVSGTATTIQPAFGKATGWSASTIDDIDQVAIAAAYVAEGVPVPYAFRPGQIPEIFVRNTCSAGSDNVVRTLLTIVERG